MGTAWSGNLDFMTATNSVLVPYQLVPASADLWNVPAGADWAEPDVPPRPPKCSDWSVISRGATNCGRQHFEMPVNATASRSLRNGSAEHWKCDFQGHAPVATPRQASVDLGHDLFLLQPHLRSLDLGSRERMVSPVPVRHSLGLIDLAAVDSAAAGQHSESWR